MTPAPDTDRTDPQRDGLREEISQKAYALCAQHCDWATNSGSYCSECRAGTESDWLMDAAVDLIAQLRSDLGAAEAERDQLREEWAQEGIGWLRDKDIDRLMSVEDNLIALAKMYGEACGELQVLRWLLQETADEQAIACVLSDFKSEHEGSDHAER